MIKTLPNQWMFFFSTEPIFFEIDEHSIHLPNLSGLQSNCNNGGEFIVQLLLFPLEKAICLNEILLLLLLVAAGIFVNCKHKRNVKNKTEKEKTSKP